MCLCPGLHGRVTALTSPRGREGPSTGSACVSEGAHVRQLLPRTGSLEDKDVGATAPCPRETCRVQVSLQKEAEKAPTVLAV